jgi:hypothetical protein
MFTQTSENEIAKLLTLKGVNVTENFIPGNVILLTRR